MEEMTRRTLESCKDVRSKSRSSYGSELWGWLPHWMYRWGGCRGAMLGYIYAVRDGDCRLVGYWAFPYDEQ